MGKQPLFFNEQELTSKECEVGIEPVAMASDLKTQALVEEFPQQIKFTET